MRTDDLPRALRGEVERAARRGLEEEALRWTARAVQARAAGRHADAYRAAVRAKQAAARSPSIREVLGLSAHAMGRWHEAAQELLAFRRLTGRRRHDPAIADAYLREGRPDRALAFLEDLRPGDVSAGAWADALAVRARAFAAKGMADVGLGLLRAARLRDPGARARIAAAIAELE